MIKLQEEVRVRVPGSTITYWALVLEVDGRFGLAKVQYLDGPSKGRSEWRSFKYITGGSTQLTSG